MQVAPNGDSPKKYQEKRRVAFGQRISGGLPIRKAPQLLSGTTLHQRALAYRSVFDFALPLPHYRTRTQPCGTRTRTRSLPSVPYRFEIDCRAIGVKPFLVSDWFGYQRPHSSTSTRESTSNASDRDARSTHSEMVTVSTRIRSMRAITGRRRNHFSLRGKSVFDQSRIKILSGATLDGVNVQG